ncbi:TPR repeat protein [Neurospora intermedia]|uniref:TPR repeat protein n=1 Tax=Neurospora intermedia TaxID=5142 RepID=A0ABR3DHN8_NEUIN
MEDVTKSAESLNISNDNGASESSAPAVIGPAPPPPGADLSALFGNLPPGALAANAKPMTVQETFEEMNKHPLFMTSLPSDEDNEELAALQALAYEGTPLENAQNFKEQGNECFKAKQWKDAKEFYGKGIAVLVKADRERRDPAFKAKVEEEKRKREEEARKAREEGDAKAKMEADLENVKAEMPIAEAKEDNEERKEDELSEEETIKQEASLLETLYCNRAACHLSLANYRSCTLDCAAALRLNPSNLKALYRSGRALLSVSKIAEADDACARGLEIDPSNAALKQLARDLIAKNEEITRKQRAEEARLEKERRKKTLKKAALEARGIKTRSTDDPPSMEDACIQLVPDPLDPQSELSFPAMLLYPLKLESDFIKEFRETESVGQHLEYILPDMPWDEEGEYDRPDKVECYMESVSGGLIRVPQKASLLRVLSSGKTEVVDELVRIFVVPKGEKAEEWIKEWKEKKAGEKK